MKNKTWEEEFVEKGADLEHDRWARWQEYMFSKMSEQFITSWGKNGFVLPQEFVDRWFRQIDTPYSELSEEEKESDRKETRNYLPLINSNFISKEDLQQMLEGIDTEKESDTPQKVMSESENTYNEGLDKGKKKTIEIVIRKILGVNGDALKNIKNTLLKDK